MIPHRASFEASDSPQMVTLARKRYGFDEKKITAFLKEGRGQGSGSGYKPWLKVNDVPSMGRSHRPY